MSVKLIKKERVAIFTVGKNICNIAWCSQCGQIKYSFVSSILACASEGSIRLVGGTTVEEGRVHICYNGVWSTVCQDTFDVADATVVCRQLGHSAASKSQGKFWMNRRQEK